MNRPFRLTVNGKERPVTTDPRRSLLDVLREDLDVTGPKYACGEGRCGACTVLADGRPIRSCVTPIGDVDKGSIITIEGLADGRKLHPVQEAFVQEGALQCGYCTGGMILSAVALLQRNANPTDEVIVREMNGHICRCNGYTKILSAVHRAAEEMRGQADENG
jgi:aerobic-type carbon monoxide dehydrogenase small subunit (CoxS/CutS family)